MYNRGTKQQAHIARITVKCTGETNLQQNNQHNRKLRTLLERECRDGTRGLLDTKSHSKKVQYSYWKLTADNHIGNLDMALWI
jgi:hypothetical protein